MLITLKAFRDRQHQLDGLIEGARFLNMNFSALAPPATLGAYMHGVPAWQDYWQLQPD